MTFFFFLEILTFIKGWIFQPGEVSIHDFITHFWLARGAPENDMQNASYYHHINSWWAHHEDKNVLWLFFEDLKEDLAREVKKIAQFLDIGKDDAELQALAVEHSSFQFMSSHPSHFDEHVSKQKRNSVMGISPTAGMNQGKVRKGNVGEDAGFFFFFCFFPQWKIQI